MRLFSKSRLPLIVGILLAFLFLGLYVGHLYESWGPLLKKQSLKANRVSLPVAQDFPLHYTASFLSLSGEAGVVYDYSRFRSVEKNLTGGGPHPWPYPPTALLLDLPLALAPYFVSLAVWLMVTLGLYLLVLYRLAPHPLTLIWALAFFGTFENFFFGQNGFLTAALLGGGLLFLEVSPIKSGLLFGLLSYKPHIALLIPLALIIGKRWQVLAMTLFSGLILILISIAVFGFDIWLLFLNNIAKTITNLHTESLWFAMPSIFAATRFAQYSQSVAWILHGIGMVSALLLLAWTWSRQTSQANQTAALVIAILLFSPHIWYYDLTILAIPLVWFWRDCYTRGWTPQEQFLLMLSWIMPVVNFILTVGFKLSNGPLYLAFPLAILLWRYHSERGRQH